MDRCVEGIEAWNCKFADSCCSEESGGKASVYCDIEWLIEVESIMNSDYEVDGVWFSLASLGGSWSERICGLEEGIDFHVNEHPCGAMQDMPGTYSVDII